MPAYMKTSGACVIGAHILWWKARNCVNKHRKLFDQLHSATLSTFTFNKAKENEERYETVGLRAM